MNQFLFLIFAQINIPDILHYLFIFFFLSLFFLPFGKNIISEWESSFIETFERNKTKNPNQTLKQNLKEEYKTAKWCIFTINLLLLAVNLTDIFTVWFGITPDSPAELSEFVHTGTYSLIFSILLSISILLFVFRRNLNLYPDKNRLKQMANIWIFQNAFLLISVGLRNAQYITECGLTYKRIGVYLFLISTGIFLTFLFLKIRNRKSIFHFFKISGWGIYGVIIFAGLINWDLIISSYNDYKLKTDIYYTKYNLSDQALIFVPKNMRDNRDTNFINKVKNRKWQSFNWFDYWAVEKLEEK